MNQPFKQLQYRSKVSWQSVASLDSQRNSRFSIPAQIENQESRIKNKLSTIESRIKSRWTENKRLTHAWFLDNFTKRYSCNTTQHGYTRASNCMLSKRPIQVVKRMFHQGHLYQVSFPPVKFQMPAPKIYTPKRDYEHPCPFQMGVSQGNLPRSLLLSSWVPWSSWLPRSL